MHDDKNWFKGVGVLVYDPNRGDMKNRTEWWAVVNVDREITRYYRWWLEKYWWNVDRGGILREIYQPSWDAHISVVRGEAPRGNARTLWKKYDGEIIHYEYNNVIRQSGDTTPGERPNHFWFIEVWCPRLMEIRAELGLPVKDYRSGQAYTNHLTIGRTY